MSPKSDELVKESLNNENDFSSSSHVLDTLVQEGEPEVPEYEIPSRYNKDTLRILMVNTEKYFVYWEVSDKTIEEKNLDLQKDKLYFKIYDADGNIVYSFESSFALGDYYVKKVFENQEIYVKLSTSKDEEEIELLTSNTIHTFSSKVNLPSNEDEVWVRKKMGWTEVIRTTMEHHGQGISSAKYVEELERIKHFTQEDEQKVSSSTLIKE